MKDLVFIVLSCLFLVGCQQKKDYVKQVTTKLECLDKNPIGIYSFVIIIPEEGCSGCISEAEDFYMIALLQFERNSYTQARQYCRKALEENPNYGNAYMLMGKMYAATSKSVYPDDAVMARAVYYAAIDKFEKAKQVDPTVAEEANSLISSYRAHLPSTEEIFMHPDLEKGKAVTIGGWIGESTVVR